LDEFTTFQPLRSFVDGQGGISIARHRDRIATPAFFQGDVSFAQGGFQWINIKQEKMSEKSSLFSYSSKNE
jgi:hypothetical protein